MLDALSDALARQIFETHAPDRSHSRDDLDGLPPLVALALRQRLEREAGARLDAVSPWLSTTPEAWREDAMAEARYPVGAWQPAVRETCDAVLAALVTPSEALPEQLIPDESAPAPEVLNGLKSLGMYPYLAEIVRRYVEKKDMERFGREEFGHLLERIDRRVASELDVEGWMALLTPLYELVGGIPEQEGAVPGRVLAEAFSARGCPGLGREVVSTTDVSRDALHGILTRALAPNDPSAPLAPEADTTEIKAQETEVRPIAVESIVDTIPEAESPIEDADVVGEAPPHGPLPPEAEVDAEEVEHPEAAEAEPAVERESSSDFLASLIEREDPDDDELAADMLGDDEPAEPVADHDGAHEPDAPEASGDPLSRPIASLDDAPEEETLIPAPDADPEPDPEPADESAAETLLDRLARQRGESEEPLATPEAAPGDPLWKRFANGDAPDDRMGEERSARGRQG